MRVDIFWAYSGHLYACGHILGILWSYSEHIMTTLGANYGHLYRCGHFMGII